MSARTSVLPVQRIHVYDANEIAWRETSQPGVSLKSVRRDDVRGQYLGLVGFEPFARSGLHQHQGVATSFFVSGSLTDYSGSTGLHQVGVNLKGATHDAIAYERAILVSRLEGPVLFSEPVEASRAIHAGSRHAAFDNPEPARPPEICIHVDAQPAVATGFAGARRQMLFDYAGTGDERRMTQICLQPQAVLQPWRSQSLVECWVRGGALQMQSAAGRVTAHANCFVVIEPDTEVCWSAPYGALLLVWADGPAFCCADDGAQGTELFGFER
jgi:hypothetical protein